MTEPWTAKRYRTLREAVEDGGFAVWHGIGPDIHELHRADGAKPGCEWCHEEMMKAIFPGRFRVACRRAYIRVLDWLGR